MTDVDIKSLGEKLRSAREALSLSVQDVEIQTRIRARFIDALEQGNISSLPSITHARGFLRNYAQFLGLPVDEVVDEFTAAVGGSKKTSPATPQPSALAQPDKPRKPVSTTGASDTAPRRAYVAPSQRIGPAVPSGLSKPKEQPKRSQPSRQEETAPPLSRLIRSPLFAILFLVMGLVGVAWWATSQLSAVTGDRFIQGTEAAQNGEQAATLTLTPSPTFRLTSTPTLSPTPAVFDSVNLSVTALQNTWTLIEVDGFVVFEGLMIAGSNLEYQARDKILVRTGNAAGITVVFNGIDLGPLGEYGRLVERFFTTTGVMTPTATPTITPTNTLVPSPTPSSSQP